MEMELLVREGLAIGHYLVGNGLSVASALLDGANSCGTRSKSRTGKAEGVHDGMRAQLKHVVVNVYVVRRQADLATTSNSLSRTSAENLEQRLCGALTPVPQLQPVPSLNFKSAPPPSGSSRLNWPETSAKLA